MPSPDSASSSICACCIRYVPRALKNNGTIDGMIRFVDAVTHVIDQDTAVIPGHGAVATRRDVVEYAVMLRTIRDRVQAGIDQGRSLQQILQSNPTEGFGPGDAEEFTTNVYDGLTP